MTINQKAFFALLQGGLWEREVQLSSFPDLDFKKIYNISHEQSVEGIIAAGIEHVDDINVPRNIALTFASDIMQMEQRNQLMNSFISELDEKLKNEGIEALLMKGQGIAQCYERPLWRASGDIDLFLDSDNFDKASLLFKSIARETEEVRPKTKHHAFKLGEWDVELHGSVRSLLTNRIDRVIDEIQLDTFVNKHTRTWQNGSRTIILPSPDNDVVFVFVHILQHFFRWGVGFKQICDWTRLLWTYRLDINEDLLQYRLKKMGLVSEWKTFASLAVNYLGMPSDAIPLYSPKKKWTYKAQKICDYILETGSFGCKRDMSYYTRHSYIIKKIVSLWHHSCDSMKHFPMFPFNSVRIWCGMFGGGIIDVIKGK